MLNVIDSDDNNPESKVLKAVAQGPNSIVKRMKAFNINGYRFHTQAWDETKKTQNYGVMVEADGNLTMERSPTSLSWTTFLNVR